MRQSFMPIWTGSPPAATLDPRRVVRLAGTLFRAHNPRWSWAPLSGEGAGRFGGRFNPIGMVALYTSELVDTALLEASPLGRPFQPLTLVAYDVDAAPVFDATDPQALAGLGYTQADLADPNWESLMLDGVVPVQHRLARDVLATGAIGMRVPSFARGTRGEHRNVVFWHWNDGAGAMLTVLDDDERLSRDGSSWTPPAEY